MKKCKEIKRSEFPDSQDGEARYKLAVRRLYTDKNREKINAYARKWRAKRSADRRKKDNLEKFERLGPTIRASIIRLHESGRDSGSIAVRMSLPVSVIENIITELQ